VTVAAEAAPPQPNYPTNPGAITPPAGATSVGDEAQIRGAVGAFINAMVAKDAAQISSWYDPKTDDDRRNMKQLVDLMESSSSRFHVGGDRVEYSVKVTGRNAVVEFMRWVGSKWEIVNCRILGKASLG
jgi:hypothetical protein